MKKHWSLLFYLVIVVIFGLAIYWIVERGKILEHGRTTKIEQTISKISVRNSFELFSNSFNNNLDHPLAVLILQIIAIIICARIFGFLFNKIGQPTVIGEIVAGIVLGPSLVGSFFPEISQFIFPVASLGNLQFLSQVGLILFMFVIGMELDVNMIRKQARGAVIISHASIIIPYTLGMALAYYLFIAHAPATTSFLSFALFMGIAMSITAFPVLARIIQERGLTKTTLGSLAITCAAADDVTAWCILAAVIAIVKAGSFVSALFTIGLALGYVLLMLLVIRPFFRRLGSIYANREMVSKPVLAIVFMMMLLSAYTTEIIGIHALFGAFLAGVVMPPDLNFRKIVVDKIEDVALVLLLPLFFVFTGLRTEIGLLTSGHLWITCGLVILVAVLGKFGGSALAAKIVGENWKNSLSIGALMNTRGLMELIVLNIGYDLGILSPEIFAMMVLMALITTFMTGPALDLINWLMPEKGADAKLPEPVLQKKLYRVLLSFGAAHSGRKLLRVANQMLAKHPVPVDITAINISYNADINPWQIPEFEKESFSKIKSEAKRLNLDVATIYHPVLDVRKEITKITQEEQYDFILVDAGKSLLKGTLVGDVAATVRLLYPPHLIKTLLGTNKLSQLLPVNDMMDEKATSFIADAHCSVGVFIDKDFYEARRILIPIFSSSDLFLLKYGGKFVHSIHSSVTILDAGGLSQSDSRWQDEILRINKTGQESIQILMGRTIDKSMLLRYDLMLVSYDNWEKLVKSKSVWLEHIPSSLIIKHIDASQESLRKGITPLASSEL
ncbi:MAG TPA: cation:proton antiporter [Flavitalea sp.]|nr:cation:proton antiporter [Flavitalea sp.]